MLRISGPKLFKQEFDYLLEILLDEFLGIVEYEIQYTGENNDYYFEIGDQSLRIKNCFFNVPSALDLYQPSRIPHCIEKGVLMINDQMFPIVSIYGRPSVEILDGEIYLETDILASTFFMLTRWEEGVLESRDAHNRFRASDALSIKFNFLYRAVVNEYVEVLWYLLKTIGYRGKRKERHFSLVPTHDVDDAYFVKSNMSYLRLSFGALYHRRLSDLGSITKHFVKRKDPYDTHGLFMCLSERAGVKSNFFFISGGNTKYEGRYELENPKVKNLLYGILERGHTIGLHPSYNSYNDRLMLRNEKIHLEEVLNFQVSCGRQHYLRFEVPVTWQLWDDVKMSWDSTMTYADMPGFRCGVCYPFRVFNFHTRKKLDVYERPLICMEVSLLQYSKSSIEQSIKIVSALQDTVKLYHGEFVFLWHNTSFSLGDYRMKEDLLRVMYDMQPKEFNRILAST